MTSAPVRWLLAKGRAGEPGRVQAGPRRHRSRARGVPWARRRPVGIPIAATPALTIRHAYPDDTMGLARLAAIDSAEPLAPPMLVAEVDGTPWVAMSLRDGAMIADPFEPTAAVIELLRARAAQLVVAPGRPGRAAATDRSSWLNNAWVARSRI